jgi:hypothetical protein
LCRIARFAASAHVLILCDVLARREAALLEITISR